MNMNRKVFSLSIDDLNIPVRVKNILNKAGIKNVGALRKLTMIQLLCLYGIGRIAVRQIETALNSLEIKLKRGSFRHSRKYDNLWRRRNARMK
jgi:DNA-directed RNA polymerase alpha subunit